MVKAITWLETNGRLILLMGIPLLIWRIDYTMDGDHFTFCLFKHITGRNCYGCGLLRGLSAFLHLDFGWVYKLNRLNPVTIPLLIFIYIKQIIHCHQTLCKRNTPLIGS
jgi:hypothetical protein